jgi:hypothetical protein
LIINVLAIAINSVAIYRFAQEMFATAHGGSHHARSCGEAGWWTMSIECARCRAQNPNENRFCGDCGAPLGASFEALRVEMQGIIQQNYKDQKFVEVETAQAIVARLSDWAKLFGFFVGIPIAVLLLILAVLGIKTYSDFSSQVDKAQKQVDAQLAAAQTGAGKLKAEGEALASDYEKLRARFADTAALAARVETLSKKVDDIGEKLGITTSSKVSPEIKKSSRMRLLIFKNI